MRNYVVVAVLVGLAVGLFLPSCKVRASGGERFGIFYEQTVDDIYKVRALHDATTGQELVCIRELTKYDSAATTCYLTGRKW